MAGGLDSQFNSSGTPPGVVTGDQGSYSGVAVQPDGSIVVVNSLSTTNPIVRYADIGVPDGTTFASISAIPYITAAAIQPQAGGFDIVVAGTEPGVGSYDYTTARYNSDGSLDTSFGSGGTVSVGPWTDVPVTLLVQPNGDIVLVGLQLDSNGSTDDLVAARFTPTGQPDGSFGTGGIASYNLGNVAGSCDALIQPGNQIVAAAGLSTLSTDVLRFTSGGKLDTTANDSHPFANGNGMFATTAITAQPLLAAEPDGRIVLAGDNGSSFAIMRYLANGNGLDSTFNGGDTLPSTQAEALAIQPGGRIVAAVMAATNSWLTAFTNSGAQDTTFTGSGGEIATGLSAGPAALDSDGSGNILLAGSNAATDAVLARFTSGGLGSQVSGTTPDIVSTIPAASVNVGQTVNLGPVNFTDPDASETHTATVVWGDGNSDDNASVTEPTTNNGDPVDGTVSDSYSYTSAGNYNGSLTLTNSSGVSASEQFTVTVGAAQVAINSFTASTNAQSLQVTYTITVANAAPFNIDIYTSSDGTTPGQLLMSVPVNGSPGFSLNVGTNTATFSAVFADVPSNYQLIAVSDANGTNSDGTFADPEVEFSGGIFLATDNTQNPAQTIAYVFGAPANNSGTVTIDNESGSNHIYFGATDYQVPSTVAAIHVRTEEAQGGADTVTASPPFPAGTPAGATAATLPLWVYGNEGNDTITGGNGGDTIVGGAGQNVIHEGNGWNTPEIVDDSDAGRSGINNSYQEQGGADWTNGPAGAGFNGTERVDAHGPSSDTATWGFANLTANTYYEVYVSWSPQAGAATNAQYIVSNVGGSILPYQQTSIAPVNQTLSPADDQVASAFWHELGVFDTGAGTTLSVRLTDNSSGVVLADAARLVKDATAPTTNLIMNSFGVNADGQLAVTYTIAGSNSAPFSIGIYQSVDGVQPTTLVGTIDVSDPADLTGNGTVHTLTYDGDLNGLDGGQILSRQARRYDQVSEITKADNAALLTGVFQTSDGVYALTGLNGSSHSLTFSQDPLTGDLVINLDGSSQTFQDAGTIYAVACQGTNTIDAAGVNSPMTIYGGDGSDTIIGGDGGNTIYGGTAGGNVIQAGAGDDTIYGEGTLANTITGGSGNGTFYAGSGNDMITGGTGNNEIYGGAGFDTLNGSAGQNNWIQAGSGGGLITGGSGNDWLYGGSAGTTTIDGGSGTEVIHGGAGTNFSPAAAALTISTAVPARTIIYGNGVNDLLRRRNGAKNYILPNPNDNEPGQHSGQRLQQQPDLRRQHRCQRQHLFGRLSTLGPRLRRDLDLRRFNSGVRLGESGSTPVAVYANVAT